VISLLISGIAGGTSEGGWSVGIDTLDVKRVNQ